MRRAFKFRAYPTQPQEGRAVTTSDGEVVPNPRFLAASAQMIADLQRRKARACPGSGNRKRNIASRAGLGSGRAPTAA